MQNFDRPNTAEVLSRIISVGDEGTEHFWELPGWVLMPD